MDRRSFVAGLAAATLVPRAAVSSETRPWEDILAGARGQTVYWNAWAGDERTNAFIAWTGEEMRRRFGVAVVHVRLRDTAEAVARVVAEKQAGRGSGGSVDLIWINGPNFLAMKTQGLLHGPFAEALPNWRFVDTTRKRSNVIDFTVPVEGFAAPWRMAQVVYVYDSARLAAADLPRSIPAMLAWAQGHPGRLTHPTVRNFLGATFLKQALAELAPDPDVLQRPADDAAFETAAAPLWVWYAALRPNLWRQGREFPETGPAQRQLLDDGEIDIAISFNPSEAAVSIANRLLPPTARVFVLERGTIGNTSFVAIPFNAANKEGAMAVANFLLEPATQAYAQDPRHMGNFTVLDLGKLDAADRQRFLDLRSDPALPTNEELGVPLPEPHPSWMTRLVAAWEARTH
ncbi:ABC transporter substrate-binding protein [Blastochloris tepida]|uniref:ABC transporter substrate-binding protein n=1 Tax=Blastochloris tepida TaxID=2233851 RepID=A0A348FVV7_9HYPH|nr:ABC transporter substrate-binding protein [Blastochloris tepida]BBF91440.1 ABC transporter substrate-binding protein [Blastochloris tepida]